MPVAFKCPKCSKVFKVKDELAGKVAGCTCGAKFRIPMPKVHAPPPPPPPEPVQHDPLEEDVMASSEELFDDQEPMEDYDPEPEPEEDLLEEAEDDDTGVEDLLEDEPEEDDEDDDEGGDEDDEDDEDDDDDDDDDEGAAKSWAGRALIWVGTACLVASLFLPWLKTAPDKLGGGNKPKATPVKEGEKGNTEEAADKTETTMRAVITDGMIMAVTDEDVVDDENGGIGEDAGEGAEKADEKGEGWEDDDDGDKKKPKKASSSTSPQSTGLKLVESISGKTPLIFAIFGACGIAGILALLAIIPGKILKGGAGMGLGLFLSLAVLGSTGATLFGISTVFEGGFGAVFGAADLGLFLALGGSVACFIGGILCSLGAFKGGGSGDEAEKPARGGRGALGAAKAKKPAAMPRGSTVRMKPPTAGGDAAEDDAKSTSGTPSAAKKPMKPPFGGPKKGSKKVSRKVVLRPKKK